MHYIVYSKYFNFQYSWIQYIEASSNASNDRAFLD